VNVPSHISIKCIEYHCLIPSSAANLSAISPSKPPRSPSIVLEMLCVMLLNQDVREVAVAVELLEVVDVGTRTWPSVEVLS